ncbi:MAG: type VI secretion system lipoprotein TssJ [Gammaproteobacteria bacterium]
MLKQGYFSACRSAFVVLLLVLLVSCNKSIPVYLIANKNLNPNENLAALPVEVKLFVLKNDKPFLRSSFYNLWHNNLNSLGDSVITRKTMIIPPKSKQLVHLNHDENAKYIGVVAIFRNINHARWRVIKAINQAEKMGLKNITIELIKNKLIIR